MGPNLRLLGEHRLLLAFSLVVLLAGATAALRSHGSPAADDFASQSRLASAYGRVVAGRTQQPQLADLGFDAARPGARTLTGLGVQEYFMTGSSRDFDNFDPAIQACFDGQDRCTALVFPLTAGAEKDGFLAAHAAARETGRIVFLLRSGRVMYKAISGG